MVSGTMDAHQLENLMENEIVTNQEDAEIPVQAIHKLADATPAFDIVAELDGHVRQLTSR